jgi:glyceraldehyde 3-phosphate dehydrogenase
MTLNVAINGFGRIGRNVLRALLESGRDDIRVVAINDLAPLATNAHLFEFDSVHGRLRTPITLGENTIDVGMGPIRVSAERSPDKLAWDDVDVALECTGIFRSSEAAELYLENGSSKVLMSAPAKSEGIKTIVFGVNDDILADGDRVASNGSCTTNCLAPVAQILDDEFGIIRGTMTTIHAYTGSQPTHDRATSDLARGRAAALSMVPTSTGAAKAIGLVLPHLAGKLYGTAIRVPTPNVSCVDLTVEVEKSTTIEAVNAAFTAAANGRLAGVLAVESRPLVSVDLNHDAHSSTVALDNTHVQDGTMIRVLAWYDNEWGFSNRMLDTAAKLGAGL